VVKSLWIKLARDLWQARGRSAMMVVVIAVSLFGIGAILSAYAILRREVSRNYLETNPAAATIELEDGIDDTLLTAVRARPEIADAQARRSVLARVQVGPDEWRPLLLFIVPDFADMRVSRFWPDAGAWPPPTGTMLLERSALEVLGAQVDAELVVKTPNGAAQVVRLAGLAHDPGLAPAWQERAGYGYITPATLAWLGEDATLDELKIVFREPAPDAAVVDERARELAAWLTAQGSTVHAIQVPPPGRHPHQGQMEAIMLLLLIFSLLSLGLSAILVATMVAGMLAQQVRQIGVLKAVGAETSQVVQLYLALVAVVAVAAWLLALPLGIVAGRAFAAVVAGMLNITIASTALPWWVFAVQGAAALLVPLLVAAGPILRGARVSVREAISDYGVKAERPGRGLDRLLGRLRGLDRALLLALRNTFRRRGRLLLTLGLLAAGGAMFLASLNTALAWQQAIADGMDTRRFDAEIRLNRPEPQDALLARVGAIPGVTAVEGWSLSEADPIRAEAFEIRRTYPDGGHGSFLLRATPPDSRLVQLPVLSGRWLTASDADGVVLNHLAAGQLSGVTVGDTVELTVEGRTATWQVVGIVREIGAPATAYVADTAFAQAQSMEGEVNAMRVVFASDDPAQRGAVMRAIEQSLDDGGISVASVITDTELRLAVDGHIAILIALLLGLAVLMATVGLLGLTATMSTSVVERTREFGVLQTIGGTPGTVLQIVVTEGVVVGALSWLIALALALPLSLLVGAVLGNLAFRITLPLVYSPPAVALWLLLVVIGAALASALPAWRASRMTIRETLAYT
jgi:putative ABC transport system permease protein